jgi:pimeloyl-ACP methyl ester carboxylesterase
MLYADSTRLSLATGSEVQAFVRTEPSENRQKCLLLHGNPGTMLDWQRLIPLLSSVADIAAFDLPGFGRSPRASSHAECLSLDRLADCAIAVADALSWTDPCFIIGHSHGGGVAQVAAARYPERIAGIVPISTLSARKHGSYRWLSLPFAEAALRLAGFTLRSSALRPVGRFITLRVMKAVFSPEPVPAERVERELGLFSSSSEVLVSMVHVAQGRPCQHLAHSAARIRCPVLFIHGELDALVPLEYVRAIHELMVEAGGQSELRVLPGAGHMVTDYQAADVADHITQFLSRSQISDHGCPTPG